MPTSDQSQQTEKNPQPESTSQLGFIVEQEAHRVLSEAQLGANPDLVAKGWQRRFVTDSRRIKEVTDLYDELGFEIHAEPVQAEEFDDDCEDCGLVALLKFSTIYTRKKR